MSYETNPLAKDDQVPTKAISAENNRAEWLAWRKLGIGGSDAAAILGLDPYRNALDVYIDKTTHNVTDKENLILTRGLKLEPLAAERYAEETGRKLRRQPAKVHPEHDFIRCSIDRQIIASAFNPTGLLELKTANTHVFRKMKMEGLPQKYIIQVMHNMMVWGYDWSGFGVLCPDTWEFMHFDIQQNEEIAAALIEQEAAFWKLVMDRTPPEIEKKKMPKMPELGGEVLTCDSGEFADAVAALSEATSLANQAGELKDAAQARVKKIMAEMDTDAIEGAGYRFYHRQQAGRKTFDKKALQAAHPEVDLSKFEKAGNPFMMFRAFELGGM
jgi:putative phage-type endonuclease